MKTTQPRKQRKRLYQAPLHRRYKQFSAPLSAKLKESHNTNSIPVRTGDTVKLMRGNQKGFEGKVAKIDRTKYKIFVEGMTREKVDGTALPIPIHPSKVMITRLNLDDKWRRKMLKRTGSSQEAEAPPEIKKQEKDLKSRKKKRKKATPRPRATVKKSGGA